MPDENENDTRDIVRRVQQAHVPMAPETLRLGEQQELDLRDLTPEQASAIVSKAHEKAVERDDRRQRLKDDLTVTAAKLGTYTKTVQETAQDNAAITITNVHEDSLGRTEIIVGNTDTARKGKLSRSQAGFGDTAKMWLIFAAIVAAVVIIVAALQR